MSTDLLETVMEGAMVNVKTAEEKAKQTLTNTPTSMTDLQNKLVDIVGNQDASTALVKMVRIKKAINALELMEKALMPAANAEFAAAPGGVMALDNGTATAKTYTYPKKYDYPENVKRLESDLKTAKKVAQANGTATVINRPLGPDDRIFTISLV